MKRPISVTILALVYLAVGVIGFAYHFRPILATHAIHADDVMVEVSELLAIVCGMFILQGRNWARWLALAWMAFHVGVSFLHNFREIAVHTVFLFVIALILFRPKAVEYFRRA